MRINIFNMKWCVILYVIFLNLQYNYGLKTHTRRKRIIGGYTSPEGLFPYAVSLQIYKFKRYEHFCGGAIISERFILSSAHCVVFQDEEELQCMDGKYVHSARMKNSIIAVVGTNVINVSSGTTYEIASYLYHTDFSFKSGLHDISLIKTVQEIQFDTFVSPISIYNEAIPVNSEVIVPGWGWSSYPGETSNTLKYIDLRTISYEDCSRMWSRIFRSQICTSTLSGEGVCTSDSGGPLIYNGALVGLVSFGIPCAAGYPDVFTNVSYLEPWVTYNVMCLSQTDL